MGKSGENREAEIGCGGEPCLFGGRKLLGAPPRFVQAECLASSLASLFHLWWVGRPGVGWQGVRVQRAWPLDGRNGRGLLRRLSLMVGAEALEACFLTRGALNQPLRSAWEDDTCLGLQSEGTRSKK